MKLRAWLFPNDPAGISGESTQSVYDEHFLDNPSKEAKEVPKKNFFCSECKKGFATKPGLKQHSQIHTASERFHCPECKRPFTRKGNMKDHLRMQHGSDLDKSIKHTERNTLATPRTDRVLEAHTSVTSEEEGLVENRDNRKRKARDGQDRTHKRFKRLSIE